MKGHKIIAWLTGTLTLAIAAGGFVLSYNALRHVALAAGLAPGLAALWPLLIDTAMVVFSLSVLNSKLKGNSQKGGWLLVAFFTILTLAFNAVHAGLADLTTLAVAFVPPVALFLSFERFMFQLGDSIRTGDTMVAGVAGADTSVNTQKAVSVNTHKPKKLTAGHLKLNSEQQQIVDSVKKGVTSNVKLGDTLGVSRQTAGKKVQVLIDSRVLQREGNKLTVVNGW